MSSSILQAGDFSNYPPLARQFVQGHLVTLQNLPRVLAALLLSRIVEYDWQFPAERAELERELNWLSSSSSQLPDAIAAFAALPLPDELKHCPFAQQPVAFVEKLTAWLWSSHEIDAFHAAAIRYGEAVHSGQADISGSGASRLCIVIIGRGAQPGQLALFEKLKPRGTYFSQVEPEHGLEQALAAIQSAAAQSTGRYRHWYVDGGVPEATAEGNASEIVTLSYQTLSPLRLAVLHEMETARSGGIVGGPEALRSMLARMRPEQFGCTQLSNDDLMRHFALQLFTEGSGTQIFSTTFVQWAGREILRRAQPQTLLLRYAPRQVDRPMNDLMRAESEVEKLDPQGSLIDGNMGAYYTWINLMRLPGSQSARFFAWFEDQNQAIAISPTMPKGTTSDQSCSVAQILQWMA